MPLTRLFALFLVLLAVGGGFFWWSAQQAPAPLSPLDEANASGATPTPADGTVEPARADGVERAEANDPMRTSAAPAGAAAPAAQAPRRSVTGRVVDEAGQPVAKAEVLSFAFDPGFDPNAEADRDRMRDFDPDVLRQRLEQARREAPTAVTGEDGRFRLEVRGGRRGVPLRVLSPGFVRFDRTVNPANATANANGANGVAAVDETRELDAGDLVLRRGAIVRGRVVDAAGAGVAGAFVGIEPGEAAPAAGNAGNPANGTPTNGGRGARFERMLGGNGAGDAADGARGPFGRGGIGNFWRQIPGAERFAGVFGDEVTTAADGSFELPNVEPGTFTVRARHDEHPTVRRDDVQVLAGAALDELVLTFGPNGAISGKLTGVPAGVRGLRVVAAPAAAATAPAGGAEAGPFPGIDFGEIQQMAQSFGFATERDVAPAADGSFALRGLRRGVAYRVYAVQRGAGVVGDAVCSDRRELAAPAAEVELRFDAGVQVVFQVVAADSASPIQSMAVDHRFRGGTGMEAMMAMMQQGRSRARDYPDGRVQLIGLRPRTGQKLEVAIESLGFQDHRIADLELPESGVVDLGVVKLVPGPIVRVHVVEGATGKPVVGANVVFAAIADQPAATNAAAGFDPATMATRWRDMMARGEQGGGGLRTDAEGRCVANAPSGAARFTVAVRHREFAPARSAELRPSGAAPIDVELRLDNGGEVEIAVVDPDGKPVANARVDHRTNDERADGRPDNRSTDANGVVVFDRLVAGEHRFKLAPRGGGGGGPDFAAMAAQFAPGAADDASWQRAAVTVGQRTMLRLQQERRVSLQGIVRQNGAPVPGARVAFVEGTEDQGGDLRSMMADFGGGGGGRGRNARTGDDGAFELSNLPAGSHRLRVTVTGRTMPTVVPVVLGFGANLVDVALDNTSLAGRVLGPDGSPVAEAQVAVSVVRAATGNDALGGLEEMAGGLQAMAGARGGRGAKTDGDGQFVLPGVQPGVKLRLRATAKGLAAASVELDGLTAGEQRTGIELRLSTSGQVKVTVANSSSPFAALRARMLDAAGQPRADVGAEMQVLRRGEATIDGLRPGTWRIELIAGLDGVKDSRVVEVVAGQTVDVSF